MYNLDTIQFAKDKAYKRTLLHYLSSGCRASTVLPLMEGMIFNLYNGQNSCQRCVFFDVMNYHTSFG